MQKIIACLLASAALGSFAGCQSQDTTAAHRKTGSYAAARHNMTGSNIPQPYSADNVNSTMDTDSLSRMQNQQTNLGGGLGGGASGGR